MAGFFTALLLAAISGICVLAVQFPKLYRDQIFGKLNIAAIAIFGLLMAYNLGVVRASGAIYNLIPTEKLTIYNDAIKRTDIPTFWLLLGFIGFDIFLVVLLWLSYLIDKERAKEHSKDSNSA